MKRNFLYLVVLTLFALLVLWMSTSDDGSTEKPAVDVLFLPEISKQINNVSRVEIISAGNRTVATLVKTGTRWQFEQMGGYQAD